MRRAKTRFEDLLDRAMRGEEIVITRDGRTVPRLPLTVDDQGPRLALRRISKLAADHGLSVYDAAYLELAVRRRLPLASRDERLCEAAKDHRVKLLL